MRRTRECMERALISDGVCAGVPSCDIGRVSCGGDSMDVPVDPVRDVAEMRRGAGVRNVGVDVMGSGIGMGVMAACAMTMGGDVVASFIARFVGRGVSSIASAAGSAACVAVARRAGVYVTWT